MNTSPSIRSTLAVLAILALPSLASGYSYYVYDGTTLKWNTDTVTMDLGDVSFPSGNSYRTAIQWVVARLDSNPSDFEFNLGYGDTSVWFPNDDDEIWFSTNSRFLQDDETGDWAPAVAWTNYNLGGTPRIVETDVVFNANRVWTSGTSKSVMTAYGGSARPFRTTAMHELGHAFGLAHVNTEYNVMGVDYTHLHTNDTEASAYLGEDASNGAVFLYTSDSSTPEDIGVVHWRYEGTSGEYSTHDRTDIQDSGGGTKSYTEIDEEPYYRVDNGESLRVQFTYENNGSTTQSFVDIGFYLSDDPAITTLDRHLVTRTVGSLARNDVYTTYKNVTLPSDLQPLTYYYIGAIIDEDDSLEEEYESNNAAYVGIKTLDFPTSTSTPTYTPRIIPIFTPTPTPTPTLRIGPILTLTPTPTRRIAPITATIPPIFQTPVVIPVGTPIPFPTDFLVEDMLEINPMFEQTNVVLPKTLSVFKETPSQDDPDRGFQILPNYRLGPGVPIGANHLVSLPEGILLTTAYPSEERLPVLISVGEDGEVNPFARVRLRELQIDDRLIPVDYVNILSMSFDGEERLTMLLKVHGMDTAEDRFVDVVVRTTIRGPFGSETAVRDFSIH